MPHPTFWSIVSIINYVLVACAIIHILRRPREPRAMLAWILALLLLPVIGLLLFAGIGELKLERTRRKRRRRRARLERRLPPKRKTSREVQGLAENPGLANLVHIATRLSREPPTVGNDVTIFHKTEAFFLALRFAIESARNHVHMEYYVFQPDDTGREIAAALMAKAKSGVRCRLLLDSVGCWRLPRRFVREMRDAGVQVEFFHPVLPWRGRWHVNFRNHRKLVVIDGELGFTGSQNIGDEYRGRLARYGEWHDVNLSMRGPAVRELQELFLEDWHFSTAETLDLANLFPEQSCEGPHAVHVIPSGPDVRADVMHHLLFAAIASATRSIAVATPYFVPDAAMILALQSAAYRGVHVRLLIPSRSDHWFVLWAGRSYYAELTSAGVEILEYELGMLHSKVVVVDQSWAFAGSANMDVRSFRINFELTTVLYDSVLAGQLQEEFDSLAAAARQVRPRGARDWTFGESLALGLARLASPML